MNEKTEKLNKLFNEWEKDVFRPDGNKGPFIRDGIISEDLWDGSDRKILFLLKEVNKGKNEGLKPCYENDFRKSCYKEPWLRLGKWAYGLQRIGTAFRLDSFRESKEEMSWENAFRSSAIINLKKTPGRASTDWEVLRQNAQGGNEPKYLRRELEIIDPQIIVCCGRQGDESVFKIASDISLCGSVDRVSLTSNDSGFCTTLYNESGKGRVWIDFYHPSLYGRAMKGFTYERLTNLLVSVFKKFNLIEAGSAD